MKDLIIGACTNYGINELKPWVESIIETTYKEDVDRVMCVGNASEETREWLKNKRFTLIDMPQANIPVHVLRFLSIYEYLRNNWEKYRYVVTTDVKDVYFQSNPFKWLESNIGDLTYKLVAGSESIRYKDESWGDQNLIQTYGRYVYDQFKDNVIYNVGTIGGDSEYVKDLVFNIFTNATNRPIPIVDQAVYNVLINTQPYKDIVTKTVSWACEAGTVVDPIKINDFRPNLMCEEPTFENGLVKYRDIVFPIVHQYDRVPEWKKFVMEQYNQDDPDSLFVYRTS